MCSVPEGRPRSALCRSSSADISRCAVSDPGCCDSMVPRMMQVLTAVVAAVSALLGVVVSQLLTLKGTREQAATQRATQVSEHAAAHRQWLWEKRATAYETFLGSAHDAVERLQVVGKLIERDTEAARSAYEEALVAVSLVRRREGAVATLGPKPVSFAAHHLHVALGFWRYIYELLLQGTDRGLELPSGVRNGSHLASVTASEFLSMYTRAARTVTVDDGTDPGRTNRLLSAIEEEIAAANDVLREAMAPFVGSVDLQTTTPPVPPSQENRARSVPDRAGNSGEQRAPGQASTGSQ